MTTSRLPGFYQLSLKARRARLADVAGLADPQIAALSGEQGLTHEAADAMIENALGVLGVPIGLCVNLRLNATDRLVPMAIEEPSVVAAASHAAKLLRGGDGIIAHSNAARMVGQIQLLDVPNLQRARRAIIDQRDALLAAADAVHPNLVTRGGGARDVEVRTLPTREANDPCGDMLIVHLHVDVCDAMGANAINTVCERLAPQLEKLSGGRVRLRILSNLSDQRRTRVTGKVPFATLASTREKGRSLALGIEEASVFAERDPYRAATHNKGIMNGVDAVLLAFGQDWRAVEAGAHAWAARDGRYTALSQWRVRGDHLEGVLEMPLAVGTVGGIATAHPTARAARALAGVTAAADLANLVAAVGLAQNLSALRALAGEGIQRGHMRLHARKSIG